MPSLPEGFQAQQAVSSPPLMEVNSSGEQSMPMVQNSLRRPASLAATTAPRAMSPLAAKMPSIGSGWAWRMLVTTVTACGWR